MSSNSSFLLADIKVSHEPPTRHPSNVSITPVTDTTIAAYRRLINTLLPIRYPDKFYNDSLVNPTPSSLALCAQWYHNSDNAKNSNATGNGCSSTSNGIDEAIVVGGIQCRFEPLPTLPSESSPTITTQALYIQTLAVLSPYRSLGIATALLDAIIATALRHYSTSANHVTEIFAHVWEANEAALEWYARRGFVVEEGIVEGYYRKLRPGGARIVRKRLGVGEWLKVQARENEAGEAVDGGSPALDKEKVAGSVVNG